MEELFCIVGLKMDPGNESCGVADEDMGTLFFRLLAYLQDDILVST